jgi:hypothetical protein
MFFGYAFYLASGFFSDVEDFDHAKQPWKTCEVPHPAGEPPVEFRQRVIHPYFAEYEYAVRIGEGEHAVDRSLPTNVGGRTKMNLYWYPEEEGIGPLIRFQDHWGESVLRLDEMKTYHLIRHAGRTFLGFISHGGEGYDIITPILTHGDGEMEVTSGGVDALDVTDHAIARSKGEYLGRIDDEDLELRFKPVAMSPETRIEFHPGVIESPQAGGGR